MGQRKEVYVTINGKQFITDPSQTRLWYRNGWVDIERDQDGESYVMIGGKAKYLDQPKNHDSLQEESGPKKLYPMKWYDEVNKSVEERHATNFEEDDPAPESTDNLVGKFSYDENDNKNYDLLFDGKKIGELFTEDDVSFEMVKALNAFPQLVEALKEIYYATGVYDNGMKLGKALLKAKEALKAAENK